MRLTLIVLMAAIFTCEPLFIGLSTIGYLADLAEI